ncbi:MAG: phosphoribosyltransferase family protein [Acidimicrobiia bacterium]
MRFMNRRDAGMLLGQRLIEFPLHSPLVIALSGGGTVVAAEVARLLDAPLHRFIILGDREDDESRAATGDAACVVPSASVESLVRGRSVILVDDGIDTGRTMHTAIGHIAP